MAIAPSKLGWLVARHLGPDDALVRKLRFGGLVRPDVSDDDVVQTFVHARKEHEGLSIDDQLFNSPEERIRVFLEPHLTTRGRAWAVPLKSLNLPDD